MNAVHPQPGTATAADARRYGWLDEALAAGADIVTANNRLARELRRSWDERQMARGARTWHTPRILPYTAWLNALLDDASGAVPLRLDAHASAIVWEQLLRDRVQDRMLNLAGFVRQVQQAWQRMQDWCIGQDELARHARGEDEQLFAAVAAAYADKLAANAWTDYPQLAGLVRVLLRERRLQVAGPLICAGFDRVHPAAEALFEQLRADGCSVSPAPRRGQRAPVTAFACPDADAELRSAGAWARRQLEANGRARVGIVCSSLEQNAARAARLVREGFAPGWQLGGRPHRAAVNVSYGRPLAEFPMVAVALLWLRWTGRALSSRDLGVLLRSPFAGGGIDGRCRLEAQLRRLPDRDWTPAAAAAAMEERDREGDAADWLQRLRQLAASPLCSDGQATPAECAGHVDELMQRLGWPGDEPLDSEEFQLLNRWRDLLNELARLDVVRPRMSSAEAVARLSAMAADSIWQPEAGEGRVQLLGSLEAAGLEFDSLWVSGVDAERWPPPARPLPLISRALQRTAGMPDATPADTLEYARRVFGRLAAGANEVIMSWPEADGEMALAPSALLADAAGGAAAPADDPKWYASRLAGEGHCAVVADDPVPPVRPGEAVRGGAWTVQCQVSDPFSAFAGGRLAAGKLQTIEAGLSPSVRGSIIHRALHCLLEDKPALADIRAWSGPTLDARIARAANRALASHRRHADAVLMRLLDLESGRLRRLLASFVAAECGRRDFAIDAVEEDAVYSAHGVQLGLRIDRIDRLADGSRLIIDYKTGAVKTLLNRDGDAKELQLVVYAATVHGRVGGLLLLNVDSRGIVCKGAGGEWDGSVGAEWDERLARWMAVVDEAVAAIAAGDVRVNTSLSAAELRPLAVLSRVEEMQRDG